MKDVQEEWREAWSKSSIQKEIAQITYETYYTLSFLNLFRRGDIVLEAGCGFGRYCFWLQSMDVSSIGIDIVQQALVAGAKYAKSEGLQRSFVLGDVTNLPFKNAIFDGYISLGVIEHFRSIEETRNFFNEMNRVLKDRGKAFVSVPNPLAPHHMLPRILSYFGYKPKMFLKPLYKKELVAYAENEGFKVVKIYICDFYFPFYALLSSLLRTDLWTLKGLMKRSLNRFDKVPILKEIGSGIHMILIKTHA